MLSGQNGTVTEKIAGLVNKAGAKIASAIQNASKETGVDFSYLLQQAQIESSFKTDAKASTSSATGLYQFLDKTWLSMVDKYGDKYGIDTAGSSKKEILDLRKDANMCSLMAAEMASDNKDYLESCTNRDIGSTELYMAHFMGPAGASKFLNALDKNPDATAATLFPEAAAANKNVFYDKSGNAKSLEQVYAQFDKKFAIKPEDVSCTPETTTSSTRIAKPDTSAENTVAALAHRAVRPLYSHNSSLFTNQERDISGNTTDSASTAALRNIPHNMFSLISPVDVLELVKSGYTGHRLNS